MVQASIISWRLLNGKLRHSVGEVHNSNQFTEPLGRSDPVPTPLRFESQQQLHRERGVLGACALGAVAQRGERGLDGIGGANVQPELGGEVIEGEQLLAVL